MDKLNRISKTLFSILVTFLSSIAAAQWNSTDIQKVNSYNEKYDCFLCVKGLLNNRFAISLEDNISLMVRDMFRESPLYPGAQRVEIALNKDYFIAPNGEKLPIKMYHWPALSGEAAPLVVFFPGIFQDAANANTYEAVRMILAAGNQALVIDNPLSAAYMALFPKSAPAQFQPEAKAALAAINAFVKLNRKDIHGVQVIGASYGAFLAAVVTGLDAKSLKPVIDGQTTLLFPPIDMNKSILLLDGLVDGYFKSTFGASPPDLIGKVFNEALVGLIDRMRAKYFVDRTLGFTARKYQPSVANLMEKTNLKNPAFVSRVNFRLIVSEFIAEDVEFYSRPDSKLKYWLELAKKHGNPRIRILTTRDDWMNEEGAIAELPTWMRLQDHLLIRATGGHAGMVSDSWFSDFSISAMRADD